MECAITRLISLLYQQKLYKGLSIKSSQTTWTLWSLSVCGQHVDRGHRRPGDRGTCRVRDPAPLL